MHCGRSFAVLISVVAVLVLVGCGTDPPESIVPDVSPPSTPPNGVASSPCLSANGNTAKPASVPNADEYIGLTFTEAKDLASPNTMIRLAGRDGKCFALTMDYRSDRVNVYLENGTVTQAVIG